MIVLGHSRPLIVVGLISRHASIGDRSVVVALVVNGLPPQFQSLVVFPQVLGRTVLVRHMLVPTEDCQCLFNCHLQVPGNVGYAVAASGVEESEVSGASGSADELEPSAALCEFFASPVSEMKGMMASLMSSRTSSG